MARGATMRGVMVRPLVSGVWFGERSSFDGAMAGCGARWLGTCCGIRRRCGRGRAMDQRAMVSGEMAVDATYGSA